MAQKTLFELLLLPPERSRDSIRAVRLLSLSLPFASSCLDSPRAAFTCPLAVRPPSRLSAPRRVASPYVFRASSFLFFSSILGSDPHFSIGWDRSLRLVAKIQTGCSTLCCFYRRFFWGGMRISLLHRISCVSHHTTPAFPASLDNGSRTMVLLRTNTPSTWPCFMIWGGGGGATNGATDVTTPCCDGFT